MTAILLAAAAVLLAPTHVLVGPAANTIGLGARGAALRLWSARRGRATGAEAVEWVLAVASELRVGSDPDRAVRECSRRLGVAPHAERAARLGADVAAALALDAAADGRLLASVAGVWELARGSGAGLADVLEQMADSHRRSESVQRTLAVELAAPRATARLMSALPAVGIGLGILLGSDPIGWLTTTPMGWGVLTAGLAANVAGYLWIRAIVRRVERAL